MSLLSISLTQEGEEALRCWGDVPSLIHADRVTPCRELIPLTDSLGLCKSCKRRMRRRAA